MKVNTVYKRELDQVLHLLMKGLIVSLTITQRDAAHVLTLVYSVNSEDEEGEHFVHSTRGKIVTGLLVHSIFIELGGEKISVKTL